MTTSKVEAGCNHTIAEMSTRLRSGDTTSAALAETFLARIAERNSVLNAFIRVTHARARAEAQAADREFTSGHDRGLLQGIPYAVKDVFDTTGVPTTCHSRLRLDAVAARDAALVARLEAGGAVLLGKLATHEFALGGPSFDLPFPPARNPWNTDHIPGGSSSGPAAAVAAGLVAFALGTDTLGSVRGPAAYCGVVGLKPTFGTLPCDGVFPLAPSFDTCGLLARTVADVAAVFATLTSPAHRFSLRLEHRPRGLRIGVLRQFWRDDVRLCPSVAAAFEKTLEGLAARGADFQEIVLPNYTLFNSCGRVLMHAEAFALHERMLAETPEALSEATRKALEAGRALSAGMVASAQDTRAGLRAALDEALVEVDAMVTIAALTPAPRFDDPPNIDPFDPPMQNVPYSLTGHPALSVPAGLSPEGLPLAVQVIGRRNDEAAVLRVGAAVEACWSRLAWPVFGRAS